MKIDHENMHYVIVGMKQEISALRKELAIRGEALRRITGLTVREATQYEREEKHEAKSQSEAKTDERGGD